MTPEEANKVIAEYMGINYLRESNGDMIYLDICGVCEKRGQLFSSSLDMLILVWQKLGIEDIWSFSLMCKKETGTPQEFACIATAKTIEALNAN